MALFAGDVPTDRVAGAFAGDLTPFAGDGATAVGIFVHWRWGPGTGCGCTAFATMCKAALDSCRRVREFLPRLWNPPTPCFSRRCLKSFVREEKCSTFPHWPSQRACCGMFSLCGIMLLLKAERQATQDERQMRGTRARSKPVPQPCKALRCTLKMPAARPALSRGYCSARSKRADRAAKANGTLLWQVARREAPNHRRHKNTDGEDGRRGSARSWRRAVAPARARAAASRASHTQGPSWRRSSLEFELPNIWECEPSAPQARGAAILPRRPLPQSSSVPELILYCAGAGVGCPGLRELVQMGSYTPPASVG